MPIKVDQIEHKSELLLPNTLDPVSASDVGHLYTRDGYGFDELIYKDSSGNEVKLVSDGYIQLPPAVFGHNYFDDGYYNELSLGFVDDFNDASFDSRWEVDLGGAAGNAITETTYLTITAAAGTNFGSEDQPFVKQRFFYCDTISLYAYVELDDYTSVANGNEGIGILVGERGGTSSSAFALRCLLSADGSGGLTWHHSTGGSTSTTAATQNKGWLMLTISNGYSRGFFTEDGDENSNPFLIYGWQSIGTTSGSVNPKGLNSVNFTPKFFGLTMLKSGSALEMTGRVKRFLYKRGG